MLLRRLEAYGFKSFADRTEVEFGPGITAVVGPNGSGKSNISDAICWALGEQSVKTLRGTKMEDVIFAGSDHRKPLGIAEVSLVLDNTDGSLPLAYSEVTITRRVFRSGESEYFINKVPCRLKDIQMLFADTGLGRDALSVIGQGKIDEILNNRAEERRAVFEEAAGITKHKSRKREAARKLEDTEHNLVRISDITAELERQLEPLAESAARAEEFYNFSARLRRLEIALLSGDYLRLRKDDEGIETERSALQDRMATAAAKLAKLESDRENTQLELGKLDTTTTVLEEQLFTTTSEIERAEGRLTVARERIEYLGEQARRLQAECGDLREKIAGLDAQIETANAEARTAREKLADYRAALSAKEALLAGLAQELKQWEEKVEAAKDEAVDRAQAIANARNQMSAIDVELSMLAKNLDRLAAENRDNSRSREQTVSRREQAVLQGAEIATRLGELAEEIHRLQQVKERAKEENRRLERKAAALQQEIQIFESRHKVLADMQRAYEGYGKGVRAVMTRPETHWADGVCGVVADLLSVPEAYRLAIEVALGGALQNVVTKTATVAKQAIAFLKRTEQGRATFLPLDVITPQDPRDYELAAARMPGALGLAIDLVKFAPEYQAAMQFLLGRIIIAEHIDAALSIAKETGFRTRIVTLEGDVLSPGGSITGGSQDKRGSGLLGRGEELASLEEKINALRAEWTGVQDAAAAAGKIAAECEHKIERLAGERHRLQLAEASLAKETEQAGEELARLAKMAEVIGIETGQIQERVAALHSKRTELVAEIGRLLQDEQQNKDTRETYQREVAAWHQRKEQLTQEVTELKIALAGAQHLETAARESLVRLETARNEAVCLLETKENEIRQLKDKQATQEELLAQWEQQRKTLTAAKNQQEQELTVVRQQRYQALQGVNTLDRQIRELRRQSQELQSRLHEMDMLAARVRFEITHIREKLATDYGIGPDEPLPISEPHTDREQMEADILRLKQQIADLGPVNPAAIDDYQRLKGRYEFLRQQSRDLEDAKAALCRVIAEIDATMQQQFLATFTAVREQFQHVFVQLFGGGKADLLLTDAANLLETGVEIVAQPPGKKLQNLTLLSGGERALTVIALLFAMLAVRPTPFCVIDEIDAALDEANVKRFAELLRDFTKRTQFIIVTHRKGTMEVADVLHGITMEESGVSKLISVKFMEKVS